MGLGQSATDEASQAFGTARQQNSSITCSKGVIESRSRHQDGPPITTRNPGSLSLDPEPASDVDYAAGGDAPSPGCGARGHGSASAMTSRPLCSHSRSSRLG
jgi:hypothetical protein